MADDAAFVAGVGDVSDGLRGLDDDRGFVGARPAISSGVKATSNGRAAFNAATSWRVFSGLSSITISKLSRPKPSSPSTIGREWLNRAIPYTSHKITFAT